MKRIFLAFSLAIFTSCQTLSLEPTSGPLPLERPVRGWNILSDSEQDAMEVIKAAADYNINHLQLSHHIVHDLREIRDSDRRNLANRLTDAAHAAGIQEVVLWDHALYDLEYYPERFRTGPDGTIDLDNEEFWNWFKADYREMLDLVPSIDGLVLTFIETGARAERQYSQRLTTPQEKVAAVVNSFADVVIGERGLTIYARTFAYTHEEYESIVGAIERFERPEIRLMMKETPHDFFLTHPNDFFAGTIARPTLMEFDVAGEFNGQGIIANTWPEYVLRRWKNFATRDHVIGYVARTDRYGGTRLIDRPSEINLQALKLGAENPSVNAEEVYDSFIAGRYGLEAIPYLKAAFKRSLDIVTSTLYTLGTNVANHSKLNFDPYASSYARHVSGKWLDPPVVRVAHGVDREFHYWKDVIQHIAPAWAKRQGGAQVDEVAWVLEEGWISPSEEMTEEYLDYILTEKAYGIAQAEAALADIESARDVLQPVDYEDLSHYFRRTLLTARLYHAVAAAYYGFRVYSRGEAFRSASLNRIIDQGLEDIQTITAEIKSYPVKPPAGQWNWVEDADQALQYHRWIAQDGWPEETRNFKNPNGGMTYP